MLWGVILVTRLVANALLTPLLAGASIVAPILAKPPLPEELLVARQALPKRKPGQRSRRQRSWERAALLRQSDIDGDGKTSKEEFRMLLKAAGSGSNADILFDQMDADGDGILTEAEIKALGQGKAGR